MNSLGVFLKNHSKIYCYGIGKAGNDFINYCRTKDIAKRIDGWIISGEVLPSQTFSGRPVISFSQLDIRENTGIIITMYNNSYIDEVITSIGEKYKYNVFVLLRDVKYIKWIRDKYYKECKKRKHESIFNYQRLVQNIDYPFIPGYQETAGVGYGIFRSIKKFVKFRNYDVKRCSFDHGIRTNNNKLFSPIELNPLDGNVFTTNKPAWKEKEKLNSNLNVHSMKPYILYMKSLYSFGKLKLLKKRMGKTLLVMPQHGVPGVRVDYNIQDFIDEIERIKEKYKYKTIIVCLHYVDIQNKLDAFYKRIGYKIITAGHCYDMFFLQRLRTIFLLADVVLGNDVGSYLFYALSLNVPVYIFQQKIEQKGIIEDHMKYVGAKNFNEEEYFNMTNKLENETRTIIDSFSVYREEISKKQYAVLMNICNSWKLTHIRKVKY